MPLLDHLIELRKRLIYALLGFFLVFFITFYFAKPIFSFLIQPATSDGYKVVVLDIFEFFFVTVKLSAMVCGTFFFIASSDAVSSASTQR